MSSVDYADGKTVKWLQRELRKHGLSDGGKRAVLAARYNHEMSKRAIKWPSEPQPDRIPATSDLSDYSVPISSVRPTPETIEEVSLVANLFQNISTVQPSTRRVTPATVAQAVLHTLIGEDAFTMNRYGLEVQYTAGKSASVIRDWSAEGTRSNAGFIGELETFLRDPLKTMMGGYVSWTAAGADTPEHVNSVFVEKLPTENVYHYFEPHMRRDGDYASVAAAVNNLMADHNIAEATTVCPKFDLQSGDSFCQTWASWYIYERGTGSTHDAALQKMHTTGMNGLLYFMRRVLTSSPTLGGLTRPPGRPFGGFNDPKSYLSGASGAAHASVLTDRVKPENTRDNGWRPYAAFIDLA